jgi:ribulose-bisphosphate carboxylase large chain
VSWLRATYRVRPGDTGIARVAQALALEQSVEVPAEVVTDPYVAEHIMGRVQGTREIGAGLYEADILLATATTGFDLAQTINMLFGNSSLHEHVELVDVQFPDEVTARFMGPRFGIEGIRALTRAHDRPLTCAALKPQGLSPQRLADLCCTFACAGVDVIKDDHGLADQSYSPFAARVAACMRAIDRAAASTGRRAVYAPSLVGSPRKLDEQVRVARGEGVGMLLMAPALLGMPAFHEVVAERVDVPVLAHPAYGGAARVAAPLLLGSLFRLLGADAVIFPSFGGRFAYSPATCREIATASRRPWGRLRPMLPVPAGGLSVERVAEVVRFYGNDAMLLIGGSLLAAGDRLEERTRAFVDLVRASACAAPTPAPTR